jgi:hypothetical protein
VRPRLGHLADGRHRALAGVFHVKLRVEEFLLGRQHLDGAHSF